MPSSSKSKTRRERVENRAEAIVEAARAIFNEKGFAKATMAEIARAASVADGTVYIYFKNKEDLARAVLAQFYAGLTETAQIGVDKRSGVPAKLKFLARHHMSQVMENWLLLEMLPLIDMKRESYGGSELHKLNRSYVSVFDRVAKSALEQGLTNTSTPIWMLRDIFFGAMDYGSRTVLMIRQDSDINQFVDNLVLTLLSRPETKSRQTDVIDRLEAIAERLETKL